MNHFLNGMVVASLLIIPKIPNDSAALLLKHGCAKYVDLNKKKIGLNVENNAIEDGTDYHASFLPIFSLFKHCIVLEYLVVR